MKRFFLLTVALVLGLSTVGCSSDDNGSALNEVEQKLQGVWTMSKVIYLDKDKKVLAEEFAEDWGCGLEKMEFKEREMIAYSYDLVNNECEEEITKVNYVVKNNVIYARGEEGSVEIIELTDKQLLLKANLLDDLALGAPKVNALKTTNSIKSVIDWNEVVEAHVVFLK